MYTVHDVAFRPYGRVLALPVDDFVTAIRRRPTVEPANCTVYEPSVPEFETLPLFQQLQAECFGELPCEFGHCSGYNQKLNALEYHRSSEIDIAAIDLVLLVGSQQDIDLETYQYDTQRVEAFFVPQGTAVELYATTLHFAPCGIGGAEFRCGVVLPRGTNAPLQTQPVSTGENRLLFAVNKWLLAHVESGLEQDGAFIGLVGKNIKV